MRVSDSSGKEGAELAESGGLKNKKIEIDWIMKKENAVEKMFYQKELKPGNKFVYKFKKSCFHPDREFHKVYRNVVKMIFRIQMWLGQNSGWLRG